MNTGLLELQVQPNRSICVMLFLDAFILDLSRPPRGQSSDPAYSVVKSYLGKGGFISQFVNFCTYNHDDPRDQKKSDIILSGVARQILSKCGVRIWWVNIPKSVPLPAVFVGVDVFHAPRKFDPKQGKRTAKESVAAVIVSIVRDHEARPNSPIEMYCETEVRSAGQEMQLVRLFRNICNTMSSLFLITCTFSAEYGHESMCGKCAQDIQSHSQILLHLAGWCWRKRHTASCR